MKNQMLRATAVNVTLSACQPAAPCAQLTPSPASSPAQPSPSSATLSSTSSGTSRQSCSLASPSGRCNPTPPQRSPSPALTPSRLSSLTSRSSPRSWQMRSSPRLASKRSSTRRWQACSPRLQVGSQLCLAALKHAAGWRLTQLACASPATTTASRTTHAVPLRWLCLF